MNNNKDLLDTFIITDLNSMETDCEYILDKIEQYKENKISLAEFTKLTQAPIDSLRDIREELVYGHTYNEE